jgi:hypothetical protein
MSHMGFRVLAAMLAMISAAHANCSDSTLRGDYTFAVNGEILAPDGITVTGLIDGVGIRTYDGNGNFTQEGITIRNGTAVPGGTTTPDGFQTGQDGTYTVNADCTGTANLVLGPGNERTEAFVTSRSGRAIHAAVEAGIVGGNPTLFHIHSAFERSHSSE